MKADDVVAALVALRTDDDLAKVRARITPGEEAIGLRMGDLFATAKDHERLPLAEVDRLLDHPAYEARLAALCILDFKARRRLPDDERQAMYDLYLARHDRITSWDMVDRAAPRVVVGYLSGRDLEPLHDLAESPDPLRRRTAITAPLYFVRWGTEEDIESTFPIAATLAPDPDPLVYKPVGIFLKHASTRLPGSVERFLTTLAAEMPRPAVRMAIEKLSPATASAFR